MSGHVLAGEATAVGAWRKRKDRDSSSPSESAPRAETSPAAAICPAAENRLLAGCLAHEFLTRGTLFGKRWPATGGPVSDDDAKARPVVAAESTRSNSKPLSSYAKVSYLLKADGARIPGVVNPTQLAHWLQM